MEGILCRAAVAGPYMRGLEVQDAAIENESTNKILELVDSFANRWV